VNTIGSFSTALGNACKCDPWAVEIFAEEVVRGGPAFAISLVVSGVEPRLRQIAELGAWQVGWAWGGVMKRCVRRDDQSQECVVVVSGAGCVLLLGTRRKSFVWQQNTIGDMNLKAAQTGSEVVNVDRL
jgi:hypothetical protein